MAKTKWSIDKAHSSVDFSAKHMMISTVRGTFQQFDATIEADPNDLTTASIEFSVDAASIDTKNADRDGHLKSADFLDVENHPTITFNATKVEKVDDGEYNVTGDLTIRGTTRSETFVARFEGQGKDPWGNEVVGFTGEGTVNRKDYGLTWNQVLETGGVLVGEKIKFFIEVEAMKQD
ncbi:YceI family protein [Salirhabdus salicampi]|uniref:YceI family protein n=1 Tax=Salirhabdus salicampi TaxID=476102 RepID=UPI0020C259AB|nr:YceI family protein [Salirhabdus salicampi]MCP8616193.1 YceI family protein [Salirhabdus salicampi]